jgi:hypothetical protein
MPNYPEITGTFQELVSKDIGTKAGAKIAFSRNRLAF